MYLREYETINCTNNSINEFKKKIEMSGYLWMEELYVYVYANMYAINKVMRCVYIINGLVE